MAGFDQQKYIDSYKKNAYDRITFFVPKGKKQTIKDCADRQGISATQLIIIALESTYGLDLSKD